MAHKSHDGDQVQPVIQVGPWCFHGGMTVLCDGSQSLANSMVRKGIISSGASSTRRTTVAVKAVALHADQESLAMIRRECQILREVGDEHPHILPMLSCAELASEYVLVSPFASHGDLAQCVRLSCECLEECDAHRLALQLMGALSHLHERRIIHGDIAPKNIFLTQHQNAFLAQLADFGLAAKLPKDHDTVLVECTQGSHGYISPEMLVHKELQPASDLFALGVIFFQLLGGHDPFYPLSHVCSSVEFDEACWSPVSEEARQFVIQLLAMEPKARGTSEARTHQWLAIGDGDVACATRGPLSPPLAPCLHFLSLEASQSLWEDAKPGRVPDAA
jgi:serine/threonine protein kinase